ncbi:hypothetical protein Taro_003053, partial [Colocasia esculenta]|nr:hypothetical protein [Colocasia esculenta]
MDLQLCVCRVVQWKRKQERFNIHRLFKGVEDDEALQAMNERVASTSLDQIPVIPIALPHKQNSQYPAPSATVTLHGLHGTAAMHVVHELASANTAPSAVVIGGESKEAPVMDPAEEE